MKQYKNVGVYTICRTHPKGDIESHRQIAQQVGVFAMNDKWESYEMYIDEVSIGTTCNRSNLNRLINDALSGKVDLIYMNSLWDVWHNPQRFIETANMLRSLNEPVGIIIPKGVNPHCPTMMNSLDKESFDRMMYEVLELQKADIDLMFLAANYDVLSKELLHLIFTHRIDNDMLYTYFIDFIMGARDLEWADIQNEIGLSDEDIKLMQLAWNPTDEGIDKIIKWGLRDILSYYLA